MAAVSASVKDIVIEQGPVNTGPVGTIKRMIVTIYATNGSTQVAGGTDTLDFNVTTILAQVRAGSTYTVRAAFIKQCAQGTAEYAGTLSISAPTVSLTPKAVSDWSTNATITASNLTVPYGLTVHVDVT